MSVFDIFQKKQKRDSSYIYLTDDALYETLCVEGYRSLDRCPEIMTACWRVAELIGTITIHLMNNTDKGDVRIVNELSRTIDINPMPNMTRKTWVEAIVMNLLLYGRGNSIVLPHTHKGYLESLEPISADRIIFQTMGYRDYKVVIDGQARDPKNLLHFVHNPDRTYLWKGQGLTVCIKDVADNLKQATATEKGFMKTKWKPSVIVKVDAFTEEFAGKAGREKLLKEYVETSEAGSPWILPADQFQVEQIKPLTLQDLAIKDTVELDKRTVAAILGVPPFLLGVGEYNKDAWNSFVQNTVRPITVGLQQEMTKKLILNPKWYLKFNVLSLMDWDLQTIANVFGTLSDRGFVTGNEVRDRLGMSPADGLDEFRILENYIGVDYSNLQKKLVQPGDDDEA